MTEPSDEKSTTGNPGTFDLGAIAGEPLRRPVLVGCGLGCSVLLLLGLILLGVLLTRSSEILTWSLRFSQDVLLAAAPEDWRHEDGESLRRSFASAAEAMVDNRADLDALTGLQTKLMDCLQKARTRDLRRGDLLDLGRALDAVAGVRNRLPVTGEDLVLQQRGAPEYRWLVSS